MFGLGEITVLNPLNGRPAVLKTQENPKDELACMNWPGWTEQNLRANEATSLELNEMVAMGRGSFLNADIVINVEYRLPILNLSRHEFQRFRSSKRQGNGNFYWEKVGSSSSGHRCSTTPK
jgi:hypothetical protein